MEYSRSASSEEDHGYCLQLVEQEVEVTTVPAGRNSDGVDVDNSQSQRRREQQDDEVDRREEMNKKVINGIEKVMLQILSSLKFKRIPVLEHLRPERRLYADEDELLNGQTSGDDWREKAEMRQKSTGSRRGVGGSSGSGVKEEGHDDDDDDGDEDFFGIGYEVTKVKFSARASRKKFALLMHLMAKVYNMIHKKQTCTKRELFYENVRLYGTQARLERSLQDLCLVLKVPRDALCVVPTSKGLVAGDLTYMDVFGEVVDVSKFRSGVLVPTVTDGLKIVRSKAKFILFVEKDAIFQRLIGEQIFDTHGPLIMITGKGYPDMGSRKLIRKLSLELKIKVFALVDCDPHGMEIAAIVRWGSFGQANLARCTEAIYAKELIVPDMIYLGLLPSDINRLGLNNYSIPMSPLDLKKLDSLTERLTGQANSGEWLGEISIMRNMGVKYELEVLFNHGLRFATDTYLKAKMEDFRLQDERAKRNRR